MYMEKFCHNNENEYQIIDSQCEGCSLFNENQRKCVFYKLGIPKEILSNEYGCEYKKVDSVSDDIDENYKYYSKLYFENFGRKPFIANPSGSKEQTIEAIKKSLVEDKDLLGELLYPNSNDENILY